MINGVVSVVGCHIKCLYSVRKQNSQGLINMIKYYIDNKINCF